MNTRKFKDGFNAIPVLVGDAIFMVSDVLLGLPFLMAGFLYVFASSWFVAGIGLYDFVDSKSLNNIVEEIRRKESSNTTN